MQSNLLSLVKSLTENKYKNIAVLTGAGISVGAGLPDFRTPGTGLYALIQKEYNIENPQMIFQLQYFKKNPHPFTKIMQFFFKNETFPTFAHNFIHKLYQRNQLLLNMSQNVDGLELKAGIPQEKIIQAHGHIRESHCVQCDKDFPIEIFKEKCLNNEIVQCNHCKGFIKPKVVLFGERLPQDFQNGRNSLQQADCAIIMGTKLNVFPFSNTIYDLQKKTDIFVINNEIPERIKVFDNFTFIQGDIQNISQQICQEI